MLAVDEQLVVCAFFKMSPSLAVGCNMTADGWVSAACWNAFDYLTMHSSIIIGCTHKFVSATAGESQRFHFLSSGSWDIDFSIDNLKAF